MRSFVTLALVAGSGVWAQSSSGGGSSSTVTTTGVASKNTSAPTTPKSNPFIPKEASSNCGAFLAEFNSNKELKDCLAPLNQAVKSFSPTAGSSASSKEVTEALTNLCKTSSCSITTMVNIINDFGSACEKELDPEKGIDVIRTLYDTIYVTHAWKQSLCAVDTGSKTPCILEIVNGIEPSAGGSDTNSTLVAGIETTLGTGKQAKGFDITNYASQALDAKNLYLQVQSGGVNAFVPNAKTISQTNMLYAFLNPKMQSKMICTQCTKTILVQWLSFQTSVTYASGLSSSPLLAAQSDLWDQLPGTCGSAFVKSIESAALEGSNLPSSVARLSMNSKSLFVSMVLVSAGFLLM